MCSKSLIIFTYFLFLAKKMKVKLAAQTLSASVASALSVIRHLWYSDFTGSECTKFFISTIDRLFDTFHSRSPKASGFKSPLTLVRLKRVTAFLTRTKDLLLNMQTTQGIRLCRSKRSMSVLGFAVNIDSLLFLASNVLLNGKLKYLLTYKLSQDHLELFSVP